MCVCMYVCTHCIIYICMYEVLEDIHAYYIQLNMYVQYILYYVLSTYIYVLYWYHSDRTALTIPLLFPYVLL